LCHKLNKAKELNNVEGVVKLLEVASQEEGTLCTSFYRVQAAYEYIDQTLEDILETSRFPLIPSTFTKPPNQAADLTTLLDAYAFVLIEHFPWRHLPLKYSRLKYFPYTDLYIF
jgi:hypothetical protein